MYHYVRVILHKMRLPTYVITSQWSKSNWNAPIVERILKIRFWHHVVLEFNLSKQKHHHLPSWSFATSADACIVGNQPCTNASKLIQFQLFKSLDEAFYEIVLHLNSPIWAATRRLNHHFCKFSQQYQCIFPLRWSFTSLWQCWSTLLIFQKMYLSHSLSLSLSLSMYIYICHSMAISKQPCKILRYEVDMCVCANSQHLHVLYGYVLGYIIYDFTFSASDMS